MFVARDFGCTMSTCSDTRPDQLNISHSPICRSFAILKLVTSLNKPEIQSKCCDLETKRLILKIWHHLANTSADIVFLNSHEVVNRYQKKNREWGRRRRERSKKDIIIWKY